MKKNASTNLSAFKFIPGIGLNLAFVALSFCITDVNAQQKNADLGNKTPISIENYLPNSGRTSQKDALRFKELSQDLQAAIYFKPGASKIYGDSPIVLNIHASELSKFEPINLNLPLSQIELLRITVKTLADAKNAVSKQLLAALPNLKFVYVVSTADISVSDVAAITANAEEYVVIHQIASIR